MNLQHRAIRVTHHTSSLIMKCLPTLAPDPTRISTLGRQVRNSQLPPDDASTVAAANPRDATSSSLPLFENGEL